MTQPNTVISAGAGSALSNDQLFSFAVAVRQKDGAIITASSEDRQWSIARKGYCVEAKFYPYPPWQLDKAGTFFNARMIHLAECDPTRAAPPITSPSPSQDTKPLEKKELPERAPHAEKQSG